MKVLKHRLTLNMAVIAAVLIAGTYLAGKSYPVAFGIIWAVYAVTLGFAAVTIRRSLRHG